MNLEFETEEVINIVAIHGQKQRKLIICDRGRGDGSVY